MQSNVSDSIFSVSQLTREIKSLLENRYRFIQVRGEISNLKTPFSGHHYFTLKDHGAQLRAVMFKGQQRYLDKPLRDGQEVICRGRISIYEPRGDYQLIVDSLSQAGAGLLQQRYEELKKKLSLMGLFDSERKKTIPAFPGKIIVITSPSGAAVRDFLKIAQQRRTPAKISIYPVSVQGDTAHSEISKAIQIVNRQKLGDVIVLCRGGGSIEDLWAFNMEEVALAISESAIPVVSGVGHEIDTTIADLVADLRAPTPTGAAEQILPDAFELSQHIYNLNNRVRRSMLLHLNTIEHQVLQQQRHLRRFGETVKTLSIRLDLSIERFQQKVFRALTAREEKITSLSTTLDRLAPINTISYQQQHVDNLHGRLCRSMAGSINQAGDRLARAAAILQTVSPLAVLARGYSIVQKREKSKAPYRAITSSQQVNPDDMVRVLLHEGQLLCQVKECDSPAEEKD